MTLNTNNSVKHRLFPRTKAGLIRHLPVLLLMLLLAFGPVTAAWSEIRVTDDAGQEIAIQHPARRIISLSPHVTELLFAAGAGRSVVGVSEYSNYPAAAETIPRISGGGGLDMEAIIALQPDLVVAWQSGNPDQQVKRLQSLGMTVFLSEPRRLGDVPETIRKLGKLAATRTPAFEQAAAYEKRLAALRNHYSRQSEVSVFYQIWENPLMTLNAGCRPGRHSCRGRCR